MICSRPRINQNGRLIKINASCKTHFHNVLLKNHQLHPKSGNTTTWPHGLDGDRSPVDRFLCKNPFRVLQKFCAWKKKKVASPAERSNVSLRRVSLYYFYFALAFVKPPICDLKIDSSVIMKDNGMRFYVRGCRSSECRA